MPEPRRGNTVEPTTATTETSSSLWTTPRSEWATPFPSEPLSNLQERVEALQRAPTDEQRLSAFRTPVTPDVLSQPTKS